MDLGRHILAKGFASGVTEYKEIARGLRSHELLTTEDADWLPTLADYRNLLVHYYHEVSEDELFDLCSDKLGDLGRVATIYRVWLQENPEQMDERL